MPSPIQNNAPRSTNHCIFFLDFTSTALKLENVGPTFPCFTSYPSNRGQENKVVDNKFWPFLLQFISNKDTF